MKYMRWILGGVVCFFVLMYIRAQDVAKIAIPVPEVIAGYEEYTESINFAHAPEGKKLVLFFHAQRCSSCKRIEEDIKNNGVPDDIHIYEVDFDEHTDLAEQYQIRTQSSFAQIDKEGNLIKRRVGGFGIDDIVTKLEDTEVKPWEKKREQQNPDAQLMGQTPTPEGTPSPGQGTHQIDVQGGSLEKAYFAGGCFWCMEGPLEAMEGVQGVISGYAGGSADTANYRSVGSGKTKHREAVEVTYDPAVVSFNDLMQTFWYQIDPTDAGGQFADRGYQYSTAIYYMTDEEKSLAETSKQNLDESDTFDEPIAVKIEAFTTFFPAEEEHQDYYLKQSAHYQRYKKGSGRADFIQDNWEKTPRPPTSSEPTPLNREGNQIDKDDFQGGVGEDQLNEMQRKVVYNEGTEPPFQNKYRDHKEPGIYVDIVDGTPLFSSTDKFDSGTGRPSFTTPIDQLLIGLKEDKKFGMVRTEVETANNTHLGHVFNDGPGGSQRYCINSAALDFVPQNQMEEMGYGEYMVLFE